MHQPFQKNVVPASAVSFTLIQANTQRSETEKCLIMFGSLVILVLFCGEDCSTCMSETLFILLLETLLFSKQGSQSDLSKVVEHTAFLHASFYIH